MSFGFDVSIGTEELVELLVPVDVAALVLAAFADRRSWSAQLPAGGAPLVTLRAIDAGADVLGHPLGTVQVRQRVAPLGRTLDRFGAHVPSGAHRFDVTRATIGADAAPVTDVTDLFAPAQFTALTDEQKLSLPSFQPMLSGAAVGEFGITHGPPVSVGLDYEQKIVTAEGVPEPAAARDGLPAGVLDILVATAVVRPARFAIRGTA